MTERIDLDALEKDVEAVRYITVGEPNNVELTVAEFYALTAELRAARKLGQAAKRFRHEATIYDMTPATERGWDELGAALAELEALK